MIDIRPTAHRALSTAAALAISVSFGLCAARAQAAVDETTPVAVLDQALDKIQQKDSGAFDARMQTLAPVIDQTYDLEAVLRSSIGAARYMQLSDQEKQTLLATFRQYTVARYLSNFKRGSGARFTLAPGSRPSPIGGEKIVTTHIGSEDNMPGTEVDYVVRPEAGSWKIVDVLLEGHISQAAAQRADFGSTLASGGVSGLVDVLNRKVKSFSED
ncbi:ABC transporter substrate-binding protein [Acetobacter sacchari]|uniref:ABC transporter substrate-binding protein n=1 Tax=Acetobacter sacchari TaxID=2661687 RepID=A0ABS3M1P9_9PROT|nr:ABC transporter substrate-binding protein [Acetobacter sacchari]MBO1362050.1 ABC transporter substrate-binding protein [Acetobacter sacchari]